MSRDGRPYNPEHGGNLRAASIPPSLLNQYLPLKYERVRDGSLPNSTDALIMDKIEGVLAD